MDLCGELVGNHRLLKVLGRGGMGIVYLAEHVVIGRKAVVKVLLERAAADADTVSRFFDEARAANAVRHRGIVDIYDCGVMPEVGPYLLMEFLEGESLGELLRRQRPLPVQEAAEHLVAVAEVLGAVHAHGIVHRDLKPDNVFLATDGRVKVLDFGVALLVDRERSRSTDVLEIAGTPLYMSPEQCSFGGIVDHRTDIYALGVIAFELMVGEPPFMHPSPRQVLTMHRDQAPPSPRGLRPEIPEAVERVILRALAKEPGARFPAMDAMARALAAAAGLDPPDAIPAPGSALEVRKATPAPGTSPAPEAGVDAEEFMIGNDAVEASPAAEPGHPEEPPPAVATPPTPRCPGRLPDTLVQRQSEGRGPLLCPKCDGGRMQSLMFGPVELDFCPACRGVWFDQGEDAMLWRETMTGGACYGELAAAVGELKGPTELGCPACEEPLSTYVFPQFDKLEVEICERCGGIWLDHGELAELQRVQVRQIHAHLARAKRKRRRKQR